jgi:hypothetical protein
VTDAVETFLTCIRGSRGSRPVSRRA